MSKHHAGKSESHVIQNEHAHFMYVRQYGQWYHWANGQPGNMMLYRRKGKLTDHKGETYDDDSVLPGLCVSGGKSHNKPELSDATKGDAK